MRTTDRRQLATLAVLGAACLFGTTGTVLARVPGDPDALGAGALRLLVGGATLCLIAAWDRPASPRPLTAMRWTMLAGGSAVAAYQLCFFLGTTRTGVALATVVTIGSGPVFAGLIDSVLHRRAPTRVWMGGTCLAVTGVVALGVMGGLDEVDLLGVLAALTSGLGWAVYATIGKHQIHRGLDSTASMAGLFSTAAVLTAPLLLLRPLGWAGSLHGSLAIGYLGVVTVGVAYTLYGRGLRHLPAPTVITLTLAEPVTAAILGVAVLGERVGAWGWMGIGLVLAGLVVTTRGSASTPDDDDLAATVAV